MPDLEIKIDYKRLQEALDRAPEATREAFMADVGAHHFRFARQMKRVNLRQYLHHRTGTLSRGLRTTKDERSTRVTTYFAGVDYAEIHETGGTITPQKKEWLKVPLAPALTKGGDLRARWRFWPRSFVFTSRGGKKFIAQRDEEGSGFTLLFVLVKSVTIPPRMEYMTTWERMEGSRAAAINAMADRILREIGRE